MYRLLRLILWGVIGFGLYLIVAKYFFILDKTPSEATAIFWINLYLMSVMTFMLPAIVYYTTDKSIHPMIGLLPSSYHKITTWWRLIAYFVLLWGVLFIIGIFQKYVLQPILHTLLPHWLLEDSTNKLINQVHGSTSKYLFVGLICIIAPISEELFFRGCLQKIAISLHPSRPIVVIFIVACIFSAMHFSLIGFLSRLAIGFFLGLVYYQTNKIWLSVLFHALINGMISVTLFL